MPLSWKVSVWIITFILVCVFYVLASRRSERETVLVRTDSSGTVTPVADAKVENGFYKWLVLFLGWVLITFVGRIFSWWGTLGGLLFLLAALVVHFVRRNKPEQNKATVYLSIIGAVLYFGVPLMEYIDKQFDKPDETVTISEPAETTRTQAPPAQDAPETPSAPCEGWNLSELTPDDQLFASDISYPSDRVAENAFRAYIDTNRVDPDNWLLALATYQGINEDLENTVNNDPGRNCASGYSQTLYDDLVSQIPQIINVDEDGCVIVTYFRFEGEPITCSDIDAPVQPSAAAPAPAPAPAPAAPAPAPAPAPQAQAPAPAPAPAPQAPAPPPAAPAPAPQPAPAPPAPPRDLEDNVTQQSASGPAPTQETAPTGTEQASPSSVPSSGSGPAGGSFTD